MPFRRRSFRRYRPRGRFVRRNRTWVDSWDFLQTNTVDDFGPGTSYFTDTGHGPEPYGDAPNERATLFDLSDGSAAGVPQGKLLFAGDQLDRFEGRAYVKLIQGEITLHQLQVVPDQGNFPDQMEVRLWIVKLTVGDDGLGNESTPLLPHPFKKTEFDTRILWRARWVIPLSFQAAGPAIRNPVGDFYSNREGTGAHSFLGEESFRAATRMVNVRGCSLARQDRLVLVAGVGPLNINDNRALAMFISGYGRVLVVH